MKKLIIYGTGNYGRKIYYYLNEIGCNTFAFCKTDAEIDESYRGIKVLSFEALLKLENKETYVIIVSIFNRQESNKIKKRLIQVGFFETQVFCMTSFYRENILINENIDCSGAYICNCCNHNIKKFLPGGIQAELFKQHQIIGGGKRK